MNIEQIKETKTMTATITLSYKGELRFRRTHKVETQKQGLIRAQGYAATRDSKIKKINDNSFKIISRHGKYLGWTINFS